MTLHQNPNGGKGFLVSGDATLTVAGPMVDNSTDSHQAFDVFGGSVVTATKFSVSGGSDASASAVQNYNSPPGGDLTPLTNTGVNYTNPLSSLAVPTTANREINTNNGTVSGSTLSSSASPADVTVNAGVTANLMPGIYKSINVEGGGTANLASGIYVLAGGGMTISGTSTVSGTGVMFYNTSQNCNASTGADGGSNNGKITISGGSSFNLNGINSSSSPFNSMLIYQDPANTAVLTVSGGSSTAPISGTVYAPAANVTISGGTNFSSQFIVGSMTISGGSSSVSIIPSASQANLVYLVE
jgi:hypothetical protein